MMDLIAFICVGIWGLCIGTVIGCCVAVKRGPAFARGVVLGFARPWLVFRRRG